MYITKGYLSIRDEEKKRKKKESLQYSVLTEQNRVNPDTLQESSFACLISKVGIFFF